jgi:hypothetical protein
MATLPPFWCAESYSGYPPKGGRIIDQSGRHFALAIVDMCGKAAAFVEKECRAKVSKPDILMCASFDHRPDLGQSASETLGGLLQLALQGSNLLRYFQKLFFRERSGLDDFMGFAIGFANRATDFLSNLGELVLSGHSRPP